MKFITRDEAKSLEKTLRRQISDQPKPKLVLCYSSSDRDYSDAASAIAASIGEFTEATLHFLFCISGDGSNEARPRMSDGTDIGGGDGQMATIAGYMMRLGTSSSFTNPGNCPRPYSLRFNSVGMRWLPQSRDANCCCCRMTIGWKSIVALNGVYLRRG